MATKDDEAEDEKSSSDDGSDALGFEDDLWASANKLRGSMDASEYKHIVLPLVFLKYISDAFEDTHAKLVEGGKNPENREEYNTRRILWVPKKALMESIVKQAKKEELEEKNAKEQGRGTSRIGGMIGEAMKAIRKEHQEFGNVLVDRFSSSDISPRVLRGVVILIGNLPSFGDEDARSKDVIGRVYEYFIGKFAGAEKRGGEFYTPRSVVRLLVELLQPYKGEIYDGCCGSGGMFVQSKKFVEGASGKSTDISIWGQESNPKTWRLAKMNLLSRRLEGNLGDRWGDTLLNDLHPNLKADYVITNPPFNIKDWGWEDRQKDDRWKYGVPPKGNANYAWIQHYLYHLAKRGMAAIVMSNGSLSTIRKEEKVVREGIIADDKLDCVIMLPAKLFDNVAISACIWILANDKKDPKFRERSGETLFIDCRRMGYMVNRTKRELAGEDVEKVSQAYQNWRSKDSFGDYEDERGFCKAVTTKGEIAEHGGIIVPGRYVGVPPLPDDGEPFEEKMKRLTSELGEHFAESRRLEDEIRKNLGDLGFDV